MKTLIATLLLLTLTLQGCWIGKAAECFTNRQSPACDEKVDP